ncbi:hypothetical protein D3C80_1015140 [compost metagenome]
MPYTAFTHLGAPGLLFGEGDGFRDRKKPDQCGEERNALVKLELAEGEAWRSSNRIDADGGKRQAENGAEETLDQRAAGKGCN